MVDKPASMFTCPVCHQEKPLSSGTRIKALDDDIALKLAEQVLQLVPDAIVCDKCIDHLHGEYFEDVLAEEVGELSDLEKEVVSSLKQQELITDNVNEEFEEKLTLGQRVADRVAAIGGSWIFIGGFGAVLVVWISLNVVLASQREAFDPYPFILLNLCLSCLAAIQAPVIMMSQNRQAAKDRMRAEQDYQVNLKAELQIHHIHEIIDQLLARHWEHLLEIQRTQAELMRQLARDVEHDMPPQQ